MRKFIFFIALCIPFITRSQDELKFKRYTTDDGLPVNYILDIYQDHKGFLWFGLRGGICRFDGFEFKSFPVISPTGMQKAKLWYNRILQDKENRLWTFGLGTSELLLFDYDNEVFVNCTEKLKLPDHIQRQKFEILTIMFDSKGMLWITTENNGIILYNPDTEKTQQLYPKNDSDLELLNACTSILEEKSGTVWGGSYTGLFTYNRNSQKFTHYIHQAQKTNTLGSNNVLFITEDSDNNIWIGATNGGLNRYNRETDDFERFLHDTDNSNSLPHNTVYTICEDSQKKLWIGTLNGLCIMDKKQKTFSRIYLNETNWESINSNILRTIYVDNSNNIWIGTGEGIAKLKKQKFKTFRYSSNSNSISQNKVQYIIENDNGNIWISTPVGIDVFDRKAKTFSFLAGVTKDNTGLYGPPLSFSKDPGNGIWIGTYRGGLSFYNNKKQQFSHFFNDSENSESLSGDFVSSVFVDSKKNVWTGVWGAGLDLLDRETGKFRHFSYNENDSMSLPSNNMYCIYEDSKNTIWFGTTNGLAILEDISKGRFRRLMLNSLFRTDDDIIIYRILETKQGEYFWFGTNQGLVKLHTTNGKLTKYTEKNGLPNLNIMGLLDDKQGNLWVSTSKGFVLISPNYEHGDSSLNYKLHTKSDGLQDSEFLSGSCCKLQDGTMLFGGPKGFSMFHPDSIKDDPFPPQIAFTDLRINNKQVHVGEEINGQIILDRSITNKKSLILNHKNSEFSVEFVALHFNQPQRNQYAYMLEGYDTEWRYTDFKNRKALYMSLEGGEYILHVKAANCDGVWTKNTIALNIRVLPPWWQTWWFVYSLIIFLILSIASIIKIRTYRLRKQKQMLEETVEKRTLQLQDMNLILEERQEELQQQALELFNTNADLEQKTMEVEKMAKKIHENDQRQLRFFANISHEFRTPLTLIIAPLEKWLHKEQSSDWNKKNISPYLLLMQRNAKRLLKLVNQIIDFRKLDQGNKKLNLSNNNIVEFVNEIADAFLNLAETKNIQLSVETRLIASLQDNFWFDPDIMEKILYNMISNAIKYTPEGGEILITIGIVETPYRASLRNAQLVIKIADTGIGIKPEDLDKIFDRFYRVESDERYKREGTGIGLAYTKELVELHNGNISVESESGKGTAFTLRFAIEKNIKPETSLQPKNSLSLDYIHSMIEDGEIKNDELIIESAERSHQTHDTDGSLSNNQETGVSKFVILLVEDNTDLRTFIKSELETKYIVYEAQNGEEGLDALTKQIPDLIISDIMMPVMDGIELCKRIKTDKNTCHIPLVLLTAKTGEENTIEGLETGADDYITKPFNINILKIKINNIFVARKRLQEKFKQSIDITPAEITQSPLDKEFLQRAIDIVYQSLTDTDFSNESFINQMHFGRTVVYEKIKKLTGQSVSEFISSIRLKEAAKLFRQGNNNVSEVCYQVGFNNKSVFTRYFKKMFGKPPRDFIKENYSNP